jgi:hypothetical protein
MSSKSKLSTRSVPAEVAPSPSTATGTASPAVERLALASADLKARQRNALLALAAGQGFAEAAKTAGVSRQTLYDWRRNDPRFSAVFNAWQSESMTSGQNRLVGLIDSAVSTLGQSIQNGDVRSATELLRHLGILAPLHPGPSDPSEIEEQAAAARTRREAARVNNEALAAATRISKNFTLGPR